jgi:hypothetical protein
VSAAWVTGAALIGAFGMALIVLVAYEAGRYRRRDICPSCAHGLGFHDRATGRCAGKANTAYWAVRLLGVRQPAPCRCVRRPGAAA